MAIDCYAGEIHFADHLAPIYRALADPGDFIIQSAMFERTPVNAERWPPFTFDPTDATRPVLVASYGDHKRMRKAGRTKIARIEHGAGQNYGTAHGSYAGGKDAGDLSLMLVPNEYSARHWREAYPDMRVEVVGSPKLDTLPRKDPAYPLTVAVSFHWDGHGIVPETVSAFSHYRFVLPDLKAAYNLIGHGHPRAWVGPPSLERRYRREHITPVRDFADVCRQADLYICDNSSSLYEFAATGRPVVTLNAPWYRRKVNHGLRFWDAIPGIAVDQPGDLVKAVALALEDAPPLRKAREDALDIAYAYRSGAAQRAADILGEWAA